MTTLDEVDVVLPVNYVTIENPGGSGLQGPQGIQGPKGDKGDTGLQGPPVNAVLKGVREYNVKDYGALGDGVTDDTAAINACISAAGPNSEIFFPGSDDYMVSVDADGYILIVENPYVSFRGVNRQASRIKVMDGVDDYVAVISDGVPSGFLDLTGFQFHDLAIDQNSAGNAMADVSVPTGPIFNGFPRLAIRVYNGDYGSIWNAEFANCDNVNTIAVNGGTGVVDNWFINFNVFTNIGDGDVHDHSSVYFHGSTIECSSNVFIGGGAAAIAAIELHGPNQTVKDNYVKDMFGIGNLTGVSATNSTGITWDGNVGEGLGTGITLWAYDYGGISGYALDGVSVINNEIEIDYDAWSSVTAFRYGIALNTSSTALCRNIRIKNNSIRYLTFGDTPVTNDNFSAGILWARLVSPTEGTEEVDIDISDNIISGCLAVGIHYEPNILSKRINISDNLLVDVGIGAPSATYHMPIRINTGALGVHDITVSRNKAVDTQGSHVITCVVDASATSSVTHGRMQDNTYRCTDGTTSLPVHKAHASAAWYVRHDMAAYAANTGLYEAGSRVVDRATGIEYVQTAYPTGSTWTAYNLAGFRTNRFRAGYYYASPDIRGAVSNQVMIKDQVYYMPFYVGETATFSRIGITVATGQASTTVRLGIYADNGHGAPTGSPILDAGTVDSSANASVEATISQQLTPGLYWIAAVSQGGTTQPTVAHSIVPTPQVGTSSSLANAVIGRSAYFQSSVSGALTTYSESGQYAFAPIVVLKVSSVP